MKKHYAISIKAVLDQLSFLFHVPEPEVDPADGVLSVGERQLPVRFHRNPRARHYLIYVRTDRSIRLTLPRRGNRTEGLEFARSRGRWIERQLRKIDASMVSPKSWVAGTEILLRGQVYVLQIEERADASLARVGEEVFPIHAGAANLRPLVETHFRQLARRELPPRVVECAGRHGLTPRKITVRNQSSRWGSCSASGSISLNWRLIQTPAEVRDYIILHELMHLREMNHSPRFWKLVEQACPDYEQAENWLRINTARLGL